MEWIINLNITPLWEDDEKTLKKFFKEDTIEIKRDGFAEYNIIKEYDDRNETIRTIVILWDDDGNRMIAEIRVFELEDEDYDGNRVRYGFAMTDITIHCIKINKDATKYDIEDLFNTLKMIEKNLIDEFEKRYLGGEKE